jgi:hypothetical protein
MEIELDDKEVEFLENPYHDKFYVIERDKNWNNAPGDEGYQYKDVIFRDQTVHDKYKRSAFRLRLKRYFKDFPNWKLDYEKHCPKVTKQTGGTWDQDEPEIKRPRKTTWT